MKKNNIKQVIVQNKRSITELELYNYLLQIDSDSATRLPENCSVWRHFNLLLLALNIYSAMDENSPSFWVFLDLSFDSVRPDILSQSLEEIEIRCNRILKLMFY